MLLLCMSSLFLGTQVWPPLCVCVLMFPCYICLVVAFGIFGCCRCYFILQGLCGISVWAARRNCFCYRLSNGSSFFLVSNYMDIWLAIITFLWPSSYWSCFSLKKGMCILFCFVWFAWVALECISYRVLFLELGTWTHVFFTRTNRSQGNVMLIILILIDHWLIFV